MARQLEEVLGDLLVKPDEIRHQAPTPAAFKHRIFLQGEIANLLHDSATKRLAMLLSDVDYDTITDLFNFNKRKEQEEQKLQQEAKIQTMGKWASDLYKKFSFKAVQFDNTSTPSNEQHVPTSNEPIEALKETLSNLSETIEEQPFFNLSENAAFNSITRSSVSLHKLKKPDLALEDLNKAISIQPNYAPTYNNRAIIYANDYNNNELALKDYNRAIQLDPNYLAALSGRARLHKIMGNAAAEVKDREKIEVLSKAYANQHKTC